MKKEFIWPIYGFIAGTLFSFIQLTMNLKQFKINETVNILAFWERPIGPIVLAITFFFIGWYQDRLIAQRKQVEQKNKELQKAMIDQAMQLGEEINKTMAQLTKYTDQLDKIVNNIDIGICVVDPRYNIEEGFNNSLINIFGNKDYLNNSILDTIFTTIDENKKREMKDFLEQCFSNNLASDDMLSDANPLQEFQYLYMEKGSVTPKTIITKIVRFKTPDDEVEKVMFLFEDVTSKRELEKLIEQKEEEYNRSYHTIVSLLRHDSGITRQFIKELKQNMARLDTRLKELRQNEKNIEQINEIIGIVHSIKGEAFSLDFEKLAEAASNFENFLKDNKNRILDLEMNLEILNHYEKLNTEGSSYDKIIEKMESFIYGEKTDETDITNKKSKASPNPDDSENISLLLLEKELQIVSEKTAKEKNKSINLTFDYAIDAIRPNIYKSLKETLLHLVRNSIDHGIEPPNIRRQAGKSEKGNIKITLDKKDGNLLLEYKDDGAGLNIKGIKEKALKEKIVSKEEIETMSNAEIVKLIFREGFSTNENIDMISGMGSGMSVVKNNILNQLNGKLSISSKEGEGVTFKIRIPC